MIKDVRITVRHVIVEVYVQDNKKVKICFLPNDSFIDTTVLTKKLFQSTRYIWYYCFELNYLLRAYAYIDGE